MDQQKMDQQKMNQQIMNQQQHITNQQITTNHRSNRPVYFSQLLSISFAQQWADARILGKTDTFAPYYRISFSQCIKCIGSFFPERGRRWLDNDKFVTPENRKLPRNPEVNGEILGCSTDENGEISRGGTYEHWEIVGWGAVENGEIVGGGADENREIFVGRCRETNDRGQRSNSSVAISSWTSIRHEQHQFHCMGRTVRRIQTRRSGRMRTVVGRPER